MRFTQKNGEAGGARTVSGSMLSLVLIAFCAVLVASSPDASAKQEACEWQGILSLKCTPAPLSTGCIGIKNETNDEIRLTLWSRTGHWGNSLPAAKGPNFQVIFKPKQQKRADFKTEFHIQRCEKKQGGNWGGARCYETISRWKTNEKSGGGCGCNYFSCLQP